MGVPIAGCLCPVCQSAHPLNHRYRPSAMIRDGERTFIIDMGPDFRSQALKFGITRLDGVLITHPHYDHVAGFDEIRPFYFRQEKPIPILLSDEAHAELELRFGYLPAEFKQYHVLREKEGKVNFEGLEIIHTSYKQAGVRVSGFRFGKLAYITDIQEYDEGIYEVLKGVEVLIISALRWTRSPVHFSLDDAVAFTKKILSKKAYITHIAHELEHEETNRLLPDFVQLAYDGLELTI